MEGEAEDLDVEVDGVACKVSLGPAPVAVFDEETGIGGQNKIARLLFDDLVSAFLEQGKQRCQPCGADLRALPAESPVVCIRGAVDHSLSSSAVE